MLMHSQEYYSSADQTGSCPRPDSKTEPAKKKVVRPLWMDLTQITIREARTSFLQDNIKFRFVHANR